jgi:cytosine deaminase
VLSHVSQSGNYPLHDDKIVVMALQSNFFAAPGTARFALRNLHAPSCLLPNPDPAAGALSAIDLLVENGTIAAIERTGTLPADLGPDLDGSMILPGLLDVHTHLDKGHIWPRKPNRTGDVPGAVHATDEDRVARWTTEDVERRMTFALDTAYAHGVVAIRTHLDSMSPQPSISFPLFCMLRERWASRIDLQVSSIVTLDVFLTEEGVELADMVARSGGRLGAVTLFRSLPNPARSLHFDRAMIRLFALAEERGLDVDLHVDETADPEVLTLLRIAQLAVDVKFPGNILCGHCCSLALQSDERIEETLDACAEAGIAIVSLPTVNMYLQSRSIRTTPRWRGVTLLHEMRARGLCVAVAGDNARDPFHAYGDHDMLDTFVQAVKIMHLDHPIADWISVVTANPAAIMGLPNRGVLRPGVPADLMLLRARNYSELLSRRQTDRIILRAGRAIDTTLPDYRLLDDLMN